MNQTYEIPQDFIDGRIFVKITDSDTLADFLIACSNSGLGTNPFRTLGWSKTQFDQERPVFLHYEDKDELSEPPRMRVIAYGVGSTEDMKKIIPVEELLATPCDARDILDLL